MKGVRGCGVGEHVSGGGMWLGETWGWGDMEDEQGPQVECWVGWRTKVGGNQQEVRMYWGKT